MMLPKAHNYPQFMIPVTREEYGQFLNEKTFLPQCIHFNMEGIPDCESECPEGLVCVMFTYQDTEHDIDVEWYACATPEVLAQLADRALPVNAKRGKRQVKFVAYRSDYQVTKTTDSPASSHLMHQEDMSLH